MIMIILGTHTQIYIYIHTHIYIHIYIQWVALTSQLANPTAHRRSVSGCSTIFNFHPYPGGCSWQRWILNLLVGCVHITHSIIAFMVPVYLPKWMVHLGVHFVGFETYLSQQQRRWFGLYMCSPNDLTIEDCSVREDGQCSRPPVA